MARGSPQCLPPLDTSLSSRSPTRKRPRVHFACWASAQLSHARNVIAPLPLSALAHMPEATRRAHRHARHSVIIGVAARLRQPCSRFTDL
jgi:hypothetical protein